MREALLWAADVLGAIRLAFLRCSRRRAGVALLYHRVAPRAGDPSREFVPAVSVAAFDEQMAALRRHFTVVPAADLQAAAAGRRRGQRFPAAVTFDDDTVTHVEHAVPVLRARRVPATFFLNGVALGEPVAYWWELLQAVVDGGASWEEALPASVLTRAREVADGAPGPYGVSVAVEELPAADRRALVAGLTARLGAAAPRSGIGADQVRLLSTGDWTVGFHGSRHEPMSRLDAAGLDAELDDRRPRLAAAAGTALTLIAYPHGRVNHAVAAAARERGFTHGFTVRAAAVTPEDDPLLLGRIDAAAGSWRTVRRAIVRALAGAPR